MLNYHESISDKTHYDPSIHCNYCGGKLEINSDYCSDSCKEKDSVWHNEDNV
ncbi:hypothetical protein [Nitrosopumilus ureiphilus]|uniref:hypothetical protein n=1 Tax=Nitrosopumilus ureiphilus TaxID=1470067 RepID=UPI0015CA6BD8|nr:hypothetical protein [Nitrosopumilus ureiphilus]